MYKEKRPDAQLSPPRRKPRRYLQVRRAPSNKSPYPPKKGLRQTLPRSSHPPPAALGALLFLPQATMIVDKPMPPTNPRMSPGGYHTFPGRRTLRRRRERCLYPLPPNASPESHRWTDIHCSARDTRWWRRHPPTTSLPRFLHPEESRHTREHGIGSEGPGGRGTGVAGAADGSGGRGGALRWVKT